MAPRLGRGLVGLSLLLCLLAAPASAAFQIRDSRLYLDDDEFLVRGVVYSNVPIRRQWSDTLRDAGCLYARDFPLIATLGANTIRTLAMVPPGDRAFQVSLDDAGLYWLAGFPLDRFYGAGETLSPDSAQGQSLRSRILEEFAAYVEAWGRHPRLIAFVFGDDVTSDYGTKFLGSPADFYSLLRQAAAIIQEDRDGLLVTTAVSGESQIGAFDLGTNDVSQPDIAFWSVNYLGAAPFDGVFRSLRSRTAKPFLVSAFGVDAFDQRSRAPNEQIQADVARVQIEAIESAAGGGGYPALGGLWAGFVDEWWRGGESAGHDIRGRHSVLATAF